MFLIRADGNAKIGAGHLMRCLTIVDELQNCAAGRKILFVCADPQSAELAAMRGYETFVLESDPRDMEAELSAWPRIPEIREEKNALLVDSYFVTQRYLREIRAYGTVTLLDDMGEEFFPVDRIVNYNAFADRERYKKLYADSKTELILGSAYVPVRPQFRGKTYQVRERAGDLLITTGGGDQDNIAGMILSKVRERVAEARVSSSAAKRASEERMPSATAERALEAGMSSSAGGNGAGMPAKGGESFAEGLNCHLVTGSFNPHFKELKDLEERLENVHIYHDVQDMAGLMRRCDLAVTAGGSTVYELAALGVPFVCFSYAENQEKMTEYLQSAEIALSAGAYHKNPDVVLDQIAEQVMTLLQDREMRIDCCRKERMLTDGQGAERLAEILAGRREV